MRESPDNDVMALETSDRLNNMFEFTGGTPVDVFEGHT